MSFRVIQFHPPEGGRSFDPLYEVICDGDGCDRRLKPQDGNEYANQAAEAEGWQVTELRNSIGAIYGSRHLCPECRKYQKPKIVPDPRPDLAYDSTEWAMLLSLLEYLDPKAAGVLHGFRCGGLRLHRGARGYALRPDFDPTTSMWHDEESYKADRDQWLVPIGPTIVQVLDKLTQAMTERGGAR